MPCSPSRLSFFLSLSPPDAGGGGGGGNGDAFGESQPGGRITLFRNYSGAFDANRTCARIYTRWHELDAY